MSLVDCTAMPASVMVNAAMRSQVGSKISMRGMVGGSRRLARFRRVVINFKLRFPNRGRRTFLCLSKEKYAKERHPGRCAAPLYYFFKGRGRYPALLRKAAREPNSPARKR